MTDQIQQEQQVPQLTLADLTLALQTIQVVAQRGAIRADEMEAVGGLHNRLLTFLTAQGALANAPAAEEAPAPAAPVEATVEAPQGE